MKPIEISDELFCGRIDFCDAAILNGCEELSCGECHRKHPTPEQFLEEYGEEWKGAVYYLCMDAECDNHRCGAKKWTTDEYGCLIENERLTVCACTPFGKPGKDWRPQ
jgi:hypothetical protein